MGIKVAWKVIFSKISEFDESWSILWKSLYLNNGELKKKLTFFAQQIQSDNIYHQKVWEISYLILTF